MFNFGFMTDDMVLEVNGQRIFSSEKTNAILASRTGKVVLGVVPVEHREEPFDPKAASRGSRVRKARDFFAKVSKQHRLVELCSDGVHQLGLEGFHSTHELIRDPIC